MTRCCEWKGARCTELRRQVKSLHREWLGASQLSKLAPVKTTVASFQLLGKLIFINDLVLLIQEIWLLGKRLQKIMLKSDIPNRFTHETCAILGAWGAHPLSIVGYPCDCCGNLPTCKAVKIDKIIILRLHLSIPENRIGWSKIMPDHRIGCIGEISRFWKDIQKDP